MSVVGENKKGDVLTMKRKWIHGFIGMFLLLVLSVCSFKTNSDVALAAESSIDLTTGVYEDSEGTYVSKEISTSETPELVTSGNADWLFAGWYKAKECTKANAYRTKPTSDKAWAKFVPAEVLSVKVQVTKDAKDKLDASEKVDMRMVSSVDGLNYQNIGFEVSFNGGKFINCSGNKEVSQRICSSSEANVEYNFSPKVVDAKSEYFITHTLTGIGPKSQNKEFLIRPYWVTLDGTTVYGINRTVKVSDSYSDVVSLAVKANADTVGDLTVTGVAIDSVTRRYTAGEKYADLIVSTDKDALPSATKYEISDGTTVIHRNLYTSYKGPNSEDVSWYEVNKDAEEFVIATDADLYGLAEVAKTNTLAGQTVYVVANIELNKGTAERTGWTPTAEGGTSYQWTPIGSSSSKFSGCFDGQGHTIRGIYIDSDSGCAGMFGVVDISVATTNAIRNFRLENSYICTSQRTIGGIAGYGRANFVNIYNAAHIKSTYVGSYYDYSHIGGFLGYSDVAGSVFLNCWFAGTVTTSDANTGGFIGTSLHATTISNCLNTGHIYNTLNNESKVGGFCGKVNSNTLTLNYCVNSGEQTYTNESTKRYAGSLFGYNKSGATVKAYDVYTTVGEASTAWLGYGSLSTDSTVTYKPVAEISGYSALNTKLDFKEYWAVRAVNVPALKMFADAKVCDVDTSWYDADEEIFEISNAEELVGLSYLSQTENFAGKTIKLVDDIDLNINAPSSQSGWDGYVQKNRVNEWIPIGTEAVPFAGTFNGQGHTISGLYINVGSVGCQGLFTYINGATVCNFKLINGYIKNSGNTSGVIVGRCANSTITDIYHNVYFENNSTSTGDWGARIGGIAGQIESAEKTTIKNCWVDGNIRVKGSPVGGAIGKLSKGSTCNISAFIGTSDITSTCTTEAYAGGICGWRNNNSTFTLNDSIIASDFDLNNLSYSGTILGLKHNTGSPTATNVYVLNNIATIAGETSALPFTGPSNYFPNFASDCTDLTGTDVTGFAALDTLALDFGTVWTVRKDNVPTLLQFAEGDALLDTRWYNENDKEFVIDTVAELYGLAYLSKTKNFAEKTVKLGKDITVNKATPTTLEDWNTYLTDADLLPWMSIGSTENPFTGMFEGQGHTIRGLYHLTDDDDQGLFGMTNGATISNLRLEDSFFKTSSSCVGSVAGNVCGSTFTKIYSNAVVVGTASSTWARNGGMFGQAYGDTVELSECWYAGTISITGGRSGGVIGWGRNVTLNMFNCLNTGIIESNHSSTEEHIGGLLGGLYNESSSKGVFENCLNAGTLKLNGSANVVGTTFGHLSYNANVTVNNVYATTNKAIISGTETAIKTIYNAGVIDKGNGVTDYTGYDMKGTYGYSLTALDFESYWAVVADGTPILKEFTKETQSTAGIPRFDLSWYSSSKTAFTISEAEQLHGLSYLVNKSVDTFSGDTIKLSADIIVNEDAPNTKEAWTTYVNANTIKWTPIGTESNPFKGNIDGQGHSISGLYIKSTASKQAFLGEINGAKIENFKLLNSYIESSNHVAGVVACANASSISSVYTDAVVVCADTDEWARSSGFIAQSAGGTVTLNECWFNGRVVSSGGRNGAFVGRVSAVKLEMSNCLNTGIVETKCAADQSYTGGLIGIIEGGTKTTAIVTDCLNAGTLILPNASQRSGTVFGYLTSIKQLDITDVYSTTRYALINGTNTEYKLQYDATSSGKGAVDLTGKDVTGFKALDEMTLPFGTAWTIRENDIPMLIKFAEENILIDARWYNGSETEFVVDTAAELYGLAYLSKTNDFAGKIVKLGKDIAVNKETPTRMAEWNAYLKEAKLLPWMTIGSESKPFAGTFDGQGYTISGVYSNTSGQKYQGLFASTTAGSIVKKFRLEDSYFNIAVSGLDYGTLVAGSVIGLMNGTLDSVYSNAVVVNSAASGAGPGGLVGCISGTQDNVISNCWFDGEVSTDWSGAAGILSYISNGAVDILHCLNSGTVSQTYSGAASRTGGLVGYGIGWSVNTLVNIEDSLNVGAVTCVNANQSGSIMGMAEKNSNGTVTFDITTTNVYATNESHKRTEGIAISVSMNPTTVAIANLKGGAALTNASGLDYDGYWMAVEGKSPVLKSFYAMSADTAWYDDAADGATEYTISTANELYGLAKLSVTESFAGKTIYLAKDIALNEKDSTKYRWVTPIGTESNPFVGTFDGAGKTISGIYINSLRGRQGLFGNLTGTIQNVRLEDGSITTSGSQSGTIAGTVTATGNILNVYSNVDLVAKSASEYDHIGGFVGLVTASADSTLKIQNCWFDGSITAAGRGVGGFVGTASGAKVTLNMAHCLNAGDISSSYGASRTGGICGQVLNSTVTITDTLNAGQLSFSTNEYQVGSVVGVVDYNVTNGTGNVTLSSVFTTRESFVKPTSQSLEGEFYKGISGVFYQVTENDRFVGYFPDYNDFVGNGNYVTDRKLDFANYWALSKTGTPILQTFASASDLYDIATVDTELLLTTWNNPEVTVTNAKDFGNGVYQITVSDETGYTDYVVALKDAGFTCIENTMDGMYSATCSKGEWIVTVIHAEGTVNKTYISFSTGQSLSENLSASAADTSVKADGAQNMLHMLQQEVDGNSMVIELKNGHFVVYDGGMADELETLMSYMKNLAGTTDGKQNPVIIEAWVISHFHADHCGALGYVRNYPTNESVRGWLTDVKVEAVYVNEPNDLVKDYEVLNQTIKTVTDMYNGIRFLQDTEGNIPTVYRMQAGQRYYFGDITMDVVLSQELMTSIEMYTEDFGDSKSIDFNDTSTWIMFNVDGEKILLAADGNKANMDYIMNVYSQEYLTIDVFQAPHHAANTYETFTNYCTVNDYVLFDAIYNPTSYTNWTGTANTEGANYYLMEVINENRKLVGLSPIITESYTLVSQGVIGKLHTYDTTPTIPYFYMNGKHTILTFTGTGITGTQVDIQ